MIYPYFALGYKKDRAYCLGNFTSNYGIDRAPYDKDAQCSVCMHLYLSDAEGKITREYSFSILISEKDRDGIIITRPVFDAYNECSDEKKKEEYVAFTTRCVKRFLNLTDDKVYIPQEEFKL